MWHYLYFIVLIKVKDPTEFTGPESYVYAMVKVSLRLKRFTRDFAIHLSPNEHRCIDLFFKHYHNNFRRRIWTGSLV